MTDEDDDAIVRQHVRAVNDAIAALPAQGARWWRYSVSHRQLDVLLESDDDQKNLVLTMVGCDRVAGPVSWEHPRIHVRISGERLVVEDVAVGFEVVACQVLGTPNFALRVNQSPFLTQAATGTNR